MELTEYTMEVYQDELNMDVIEDFHSMHTDTMKIIQIFIGKNPKSTMYGKIIGIFLYKNNMYKFEFHVHEPNQKYPWLSNKMTNIYEMQTESFAGIEFPTYKGTTFGNMAFWDHTSLEYLKEKDRDSYELRKLMNNVIAYSRAKDLCKYFRKMDRVALKENPVYRNK